eukprot:103453_1
MNNTHTSAIPFFSKITTYPRKVEDRWYMARDAMQQLTQLPPQKRRDGVSVLITTIDKIIKNPNKTENHSLCIDSLLHSKLNDSMATHADIWINLLLSQGFELSEDKTRLIFDVYDNKLEWFRKILLQTDDDWSEDSLLHLEDDPLLIVNDIDANMCNRHESCEHFEQFTQVMRKYRNACDLDYNNMNVTSLIDDYIHLMEEHGEDEQFEHVIHSLGQCNISKCNKFQRNYRDKTTTRTTNDPKQQCVVEILDKMHCYFYHCIDIGHRTTTAERELVNNVETTMHIHVDTIDRQLRKLRDIVISKQDNLDNNVRCRLTRKNRFIEFGTVKEQKVEHTDINNKNYRNGFKFIYCDVNKTDGKTQMDLKDNERLVYAKYCSLKEELTTNAISVVTIQQFDNELTKAYYHFESKYNKQYSYDVQGLLVLMFYCNYYQLQYEFCKTYREDNGRRHTYFYWFGLLLKTMVHKHGTLMRDGKIDALYHGVGEKLIFYLQNFESIQTETQISGSLSTSSSFEVALNFTNYNRGVVIEFAKSYSGWLTAESNNYFSVAWLSDFSSEH